MSEETFQSSEAGSGSASSAAGESQEPSQRFGESAHGGEDHSAVREKDVSSASDGAAGVNGKEAEKPKSRYQRTVEWRKKLDEREKQIAERERRIQEYEGRQRQSAEPNYDLAQLKHYRELWAKEAEWDPEKADLVQKADAKIAELEGVENHRRQWLNAEAQLREADPEFGIEGSALDRKIREIFAGPHGKHYAAHPLGIIPVYDLAKRLLAEEENKELRTKWSRTEEENKRLTGLTSIGGGAPGQMNGASGGEMSSDNFRKLSLDQMRERLRRDAANAARGR